MSTISNRVSGQNIYYNIDGNAIATQPTVDKGASLNAGASNSNLDNVTFDGVPEDTGAYVNNSYILGVGVNLADNIDLNVTDANTGYQLGVATAIKAGYWNEYSGVFSTAPTNNTYSWGSETQNKYVVFHGQIYNGTY